MGKINKIITGFRKKILAKSNIKKIKKYRRVILLLLFFLFYYTTEIALSVLPSQIFNVQEIASQDVEFNDIYYRHTYFDSKPKFAEEEIVLVNIGSLDTVNFREKLIELLPLISDLNPKAIGLDVIFYKEKSSPETNRVLDSVLRATNTLIGIDYQYKSIFHKTNSDIKRFGYINLPNKEHSSVRDYYSFYNVDGMGNIPSLARRLHIKGIGKDIKYKEQELVLKYYTDETGIFNILSENQSENRDKFGCVEAKDIFQAKELLKELMGNIFENKFVIIGWIGDRSMYNQYDIKDKHRVPVDPKLVDRMPTMAGAVIHANALQMMISDDYIVRIDGIGYYVAIFLILYSYIIVIEKAEKLVFIKKVLLMTVTYIVTNLFFIWLGIFLMSLGYYVNVGKLLILMAVLTGFYATLYEKFKKKELKKLR